MDIDVDVEVHVEADVDIDSYLGCLKRVSQSVQALLNGIGALMEATFIVLKLTSPATQSAYRSLQGLVVGQGRTSSKQHAPMTCKGFLTRGLNSYQYFLWSPCSAYGYIVSYIP